jgi:hypothetical protein
LRNGSDCKDVDLYNTRKRYAVIESLDLRRNISWLASCFSKKKKPNKHCSGNQSVIAGVCIFDTIAVSMRVVFKILTIMSSPEEQPSYEEPSSPIGKMQSGLAASFVTPSMKNNDGNGNQFVDDEPFINERKQ